MHIDHLDHLVLTVADIDISCAFYTRVMGMEKLIFGEGRVALRFGQQKINLHRHHAELRPHATTPLPGSADLCFIARTTLVDVITHLEVCGVPLLEGPVARTGATGPIRSVYFRDPDGNLIEVSNPA